MRYFKFTLILVVVVILVAGGYFYAGAYNIAADKKHWPMTEWLIGTMVERSVSAAAKQIEVPERIGNYAFFVKAAGNYQQMCSGCHLAPGRENTELRRGLYPKPPNLTTSDLQDPARTFWVIKHGIKMTAMPAWGKSHSHEDIWRLTGFVHQLKGMSREKYLELVDKYPGRHAHGDGSPAEAGGGGDTGDEATNASGSAAGHEAHDHAH